MKIKLSPRLQQIAGFISPGSTVVDVGTDHAYLPIWLLQSGICARAFATDINEGPLKNAAKDAAASGVAERLTLLLCDGLAQCPQEAVDTVVIAGMGGETIAGILSAAPWAAEKRLILQPQSKCDVLHAYLTELGCRIADAALVYDAGHYYRVWCVERGREAHPGRIEAPLLEKRDPLLRAYLAEEIARMRKRSQGLRQSKNTAREQLDTLDVGLEEYIRVYEEVSTWQP